MDKSLANEFFALAAKSLEFLVREHGYAEPRLRIDDEIHFAFVTFERTHLAIECSCDQREEHVDCHIIRRGAVGATGATAGDNDRAREDVFHWVTRHAGRAPLFSRPSGLAFRERIPIKLDDFAQMLKRHGGPILADDPSALD